MRWIAFLVLVVSLASCTTPEGGAGSIRGVVRNRHTGRPIQFLSVYLVGTEFRTSTAIDGTFFIPQVEAGRATLAFGLGDVTRHVFVRDGKVSKPRFLVTVPKRTGAANAGFEHIFGDPREYRIVGTRSQVRDGQLECEVIPAKQPFKVGDHPEFRVIMRNRSSRDIRMVSHLEGSDEGRRYPIVTLMLTGPENGLNIPSHRIGCGTTARLGFADVKLVAAGGEFEPLNAPFWPGSEFPRQTFALPGDYRVTFRYSSDEIDMARWLAHAPETYELLKQVPRVDIEESITVSVVE